MEKFNRKSLDRFEFYLVRSAILLLTAISLMKLIVNEISGFWH